MRDKLIELIKSRQDPCASGDCPFENDDVSPCGMCVVESLADHLIAHGVNICTSGEYLPREEVIKGVLEQMQASASPKCMEEFLRNLNGVTLATDTNVGDKKPLTNGDRIRAMTDEELGSWLCSIMADCDEKCPGRNWCKFGNKGTIAWLKQPAEVDHETD